MGRIPVLLVCGGILLTISAVSQSLKACPKGNYWNLDNEDCEKCPKGTYQDQYNAFNVTVCPSCPNGTTTLIDGATNRDHHCIMDCPLGQEYSFIREECTGCRIGQFRDENSQVCYYCPPGKTSTEKEAKQCVETSVTPTPVTLENHQLKGNMVNILGQGKSSMKQYAKALALALVQEKRRTYRGLCQTKSCEEVSVTINNLQWSGQESEGAKCNVQISFQKINSRLQENGHPDKVRDYDKVIQEIFYNLVISLPSPESCPPGSLRDSINGFCLECDSGYFHNKEMGQCELCPKNSYSTNPVSDDCASCLDGLVTSGTGARGPSDCDDPCAFNDDFCGVAGKCVPGVSGSHFCKCDSLHEGPRCDQRVQKKEDNANSIALIVSLSVAGVVVILFIVLGALFLRRRMKKKNEERIRTSSRETPARFDLQRQRPRGGGHRSGQNPKVSTSYPHSNINDRARLGHRQMDPGPQPLSHRQNIHMYSTPRPTPTQHYYQTPRPPNEQTEQGIRLDHVDPTYVIPDDYNYIVDSKLSSAPSRHIPVDQIYSKPLELP